MQINETVREDGLRIITVGLKTSRRVSMSIACKYGSVYDEKGKEGIAHFMEHMAFKGTKKRNYEELNDFSTRYLMGTNATTFPTYVEYRSSSVYTHQNKLIDFLCDIYENSTYPEEEFEKERNTILLERARRYDSDDFVGYHAGAAILWPNHPMSYDPVGTEESLKRIKREDLLKMKEEWHSPKNTIIVMAGRVNHKNVVKKIAQHLPIKKNSPRPVYKKIPDTWASLPKKQKIVVERPKREKAIVMMMAKTPKDISDRDKMIQALLAAVTMSQKNSRLWTEIREKRGLAYSSSGSVGTEPRLARYIHARVETAPDKVGEVEKLMKECLFTPITEEEKFKIIRGKLKDLIDLGDENNPFFWVSEIWESIDEDRPLKTVKSVFARDRKNLKSIKLKDLEKMRAKIFDPKRFITVVVRPTK